MHPASLLPRVRDFKWNVLPAVIDLIDNVVVFFNSRRSAQRGYKYAMKTRSSLSALETYLPRLIALSGLAILACWSLGHWF
jgi:hypothetical protein